MIDLHKKKIKNILFDIEVEGLNASKIITQISIQDNKVFLIIESDKNPEYFNNIKLKIKDELEKLDFVSEAIVVITNPSSKKIKGVKKAILVASGKGGVGKSTIAFAIASALQKMGKNVAIVDADIYGPSLGVFLPSTKKPEVENGLVLPLIINNFKVISFSYLSESAAIWRGPMVTKGLHQIIRLCNWAFDGVDVDYLIIDSPPGTGDVHLSLMQNYQIDGAFLVTTPHDLSISDAKKGYEMFVKMGVNVLGIINNMSHYEFEGKNLGIFGNTGSSEIEKRIGSKVLDSVPFRNEIPSEQDLKNSIDVIL